MARQGGNGQRGGAGRGRGGAARDRWGGGEEQWQGWQGWQKGDGDDRGQGWKGKGWQGNRWQGNRWQGGDGGDHWQGGGEEQQQERGGGEGGGAGGEHGRDGGEDDEDGVKFTILDGGIWQAEQGGGKWCDCDPNWSVPIFWALQDGTKTLELQHFYNNKFGEKVESWYTIDLSDVNAITQTHKASGKTREMRLMRRVQLSVEAPPFPPYDGEGESDDE